MEYSLLDVKYAYLAGIVDGEGCIHISDRKSDKYSSVVYHQLKLLVAMTHQENIEFLHKEFGGNVFVKQQNAQRRTQYHWVVVSGDARKLIERVLPYLICKKQQALVAIAFQQLVEEHKEFFGFRAISKEDSAIRNKLVEQLHELNRRGVQSTK